MTVIIILLGASLLVALFFLVSYIWSTQAGQFDDLYSPGQRILFDEENNHIEK
jgi:cbb3-type cytochrome oxidase maturation protein